MVRFASTTVVLALFVPVALASNGVLEINQTCAVQTGCFPGDGIGFPVTIIAPGSYRLTSNLLLPTAGTTGIQVAASSVTVDLGGFMIDGPTVCSGVPVSTCAPLGVGVGVLGGALVTVRNGTISGVGDDAVRLDFSSRAEGLTILHSGDDGLDLGNENIARGNIVSGNGGTGIRCNSQCVVSENTVSGNGSDGIVVPSGTVNGNTATRNGGRGGLFGANTTFAQNLFSGNLPPEESGGHASGGNVCGDRSCSTHGARRFYLTQTTHNGAQALTACAVGFHFASIWELVEVAGLEYDSARGFELADSGFGPPGKEEGWVRTGWVSSPGQGAGEWVGLANCDVWQSPGQTVRGTAAYLGSPPGPGSSGPWDDPPVAITAPWYPLLRACDSAERVWCVED